MRVKIHHAKKFDNNRFIDNRRIEAEHHPLSPNFKNLILNNLSSMPCFFHEKKARKRMNADAGVKDKKRS